MNKRVVMPEVQAPWFDTARFGLFIHWGLYSILSDQQGIEWVLFKKRLHRDEYNRLADQFTAHGYDPDAWVALAKRAGMRYAVLTTRHHDGFCLFRTATTRFNAVETAAKRDLVADFVAACRRGGLRIGLYHSVMSWQHEAIFTGPGADPAGWKAMVGETHAQVRELMTNYGRIDMLWYDGAVVPGIQDDGMQRRYWESDVMNAMVRTLQPDILINDRSGAPADFSTPEQHVTPPPPGRRWEACMTLNRSWGYNIHDRDFKAPAEVLRCLVRCARHGGNLLLDIGPRPDGSVQPEFTERLEAIGRWLDRNGAAIYGSRRCAYADADHVPGPTTWDGKRLYLHLAEAKPGILRLDGAGAATGATVLATGSAIRTAPAAGGALDLHLPAGLTSDRDGPTVVAIDLPAEPVPARLLGGGECIRIDAGNVPILGEDPDRHAPPMAPVITGAALEALLHRRGDPRAVDGRRLCPGWQGWTAFTPRAGGAIGLSLAVPVDGAYDLELGVVAAGDGAVRVSIDGRELAPASTAPGGPDTITFPALPLAAGRRRLVLVGAAGTALYALRLAPRWRSIPAEDWWAIGPFPTGFAPRQPVSEVRLAMTRTLPPERSFRPGATSAGIHGPVRWNRSRRREGDHSDHGVNFPYRCGTRASGICYARTVIVSPAAREADLLIGCDWWADAWVDGVKVAGARPAAAVAEDGAGFSGWKPQPARVSLRRGANPVLVKCHPGSCANWFTFRISDPGDLRVRSPY